ncbi:MAG: hypothetical protein IAE78_06035 [Myxococcus sp.]|nr:hypothetical protein [Myxococcus sp.]
MDSGLSKLVPVLTNPGRVPLLKVDPARPCGGRMKGYGLLHLLEYAETTYGPGALTAWSDALPLPLRGFATTKAQLTSIGWLPVELYFSALEHLVTTQHQGDPRSAIVMGHAMATRAISSFFRAAMGFVTPPTLFSLAGRFWRSSFDFGTLEVTKNTPPTAEVEVRDWPLMAQSAYYELGGTFIAWMEASKAKEVRFTRFELTRAPALVVAVEWT